MIAFWLTAALMILLALAIALVPLMRGAPEKQGTRDPAPTSSGSGATALAMALVLPVAAVTLYLWLGDVGSLSHVYKPPPISRTLSVQVDLAESLKSRVASEAAVFVFARAEGASGMPLAIVRRAAQELPVEVELGDAQATSPENSISRHGRIVVGARIAQSGSATRKAGDMEARTQVVDLGQTQRIRIEVDHVVE